MNNKAFGFVVVQFFLFSLLLAAPASAKETVRDMLRQSQLAGSNICSSVKEALGEGLDEKDVVRTGIELGHNACLVVKCAIYGGGNLEKVITGAVEAGATADVVSRCALDAGARAREVEASLRLAGLSLCYFQPGLGYSNPDNPTPPPYDPVPDPPRPLSRSTF